MTIAEELEPTVVPGHAPGERPLRRRCPKLSRRDGQIGDGLSTVAIALRGFDPVRSGCLLHHQARAFGPGRCSATVPCSPCPHMTRGVRPCSSGPYSRFYWHHPGPLYFYVLNLWSSLFGGRDPRARARARRRSTSPRRSGSSCSHTGAAAVRSWCGPSLLLTAYHGCDRTDPVRHLEPQRHAAPLRARVAARLVGCVSGLVGGTMARARRVLRGADARGARSGRRHGARVRGLRQRVAAAPCAKHLSEPTNDARFAARPPRASRSPSWSGCPR